MRVNIGPYKTWIGPYQVADLLRFTGAGEDKCYEVGAWLDKTWVGDFLKWIDSKKKRSINVKIDNYDIWNADHTMALIIHPMLVKIRVAGISVTAVDDVDVPDEIKSTSAKTPPEYKFDLDEFYFKRWKYVLDEMIWAFEQIINPDSDAQFSHNEQIISFKTLGNGNSEMIFTDKDPAKPYYFDMDGYRAHYERITNGTRLFGRYYRGLWT